MLKKSRCRVQKAQRNTKCQQVTTESLTSKTRKHLSTFHQGQVNIANIFTHMAQAPTKWDHPNLHINLPLPGPQHCGAVLVQYSRSWALQSRASPHENQVEREEHGRTVEYGRSCSCLLLMFKEVKRKTTPPSTSTSTSTRSLDL